MKTELKVGEAGIEVWFNGNQIGMVMGTEGPGVQVISKHAMLPQWYAQDKDLKRVEIRIASEPMTPAQSKEVQEIVDELPARVRAFQEKITTKPS